MKTKEAVIKAGFLLSPHKLLETYNVLQLLRISNASKTVPYEQGDIDATELKILFAALPKNAQLLFRGFGREAIDETKREIRKRYTLQKAGLAFTEYSHNALLRHYHQMLEKIKPFAPLVKWYHTKHLNGNHFTTSPCRFSAFRPQLKFEVVKEGEKLQLVTHIDINGATYRSNEFDRRHFLLESKNEYFILSFADYKTLEWLKEQGADQKAMPPADMARQILAVLEKDYPINRNNLFDRQEIEATAVNRVMISELNNAFLMFTPQWVYDGYLIDGPWKETAEFVHQGEPVVIKRNKESEEVFLQKLESLHPNFPRQKNGYYYVSFADAQKKQWFLKAYHQLLMADIELLGMDMLRHFRYSQHKVETDMKIMADDNRMLTLSFSVKFGNEEIALNELQKMLLAGQQAVLLKDGSLGVLGDEWLRKYAAIVKHGKANKKEITIARWIAISEDQMEPGDKLMNGVIKEEWWKRWKKWRDDSEQLYHVPSIVNATLRPYQQKGFEWLMLLAEAGAGGCLADDMGLGKTIQAICFLASRIQKKPEAKYLIVCPASLVYNWKQELEKFMPSVSILTYYGNQRREEQLNDESLQVIITTYGTLRADTGALLPLQYDVAIIDESHNIKNPTAQSTQAINLIKAGICIALSGTPVVNNTFDLYSQLNVVVPGLFGSREFFKREYADAIDRFGNQEKLQALQKMTAPFILRRTKEQVATDLPEKTEIMLWCEMTAPQRELYESIKDQVKSNLFLDIQTKGLAKSKLAVIQGILKLRQVCNSPLLLPEDEYTCSDSVKTEVLIEELKNILPGHKALVFSQFASMLDLFAAECEKQGIAYYHFDGQTPAAKRAEMVNAFQQEGNKTNLFLISLKAGNTGLTLTAADYVFLFDPWWNTAVQQQAIDRTHRIGQTKNVFAYKMICKDTIEEKIIHLQQRKKQLADDLISADEGFIKALDEEDIAYLFE